MPANLTKTLVVPQWDSKNVVLFTPSTTPATLGQAVLNSNFTVVESVLSKLFDGATGYPNVCLVSGSDLYIAVTALNSGDAAGVVKFPGYLSDPASAIGAAFVVNEDQNAYLGLAMDADGNLYASAGPAVYGDTSIFRYSGAGSAAGYVTGVDLGNAGQTSFFGDLALDSQGNLWAADYLNNRLVAFGASSLGGTAKAAWVALGNPASSATTLAVANTDNTFPKTISYLFTSPEGLDFDSFGSDANLWVGNNNDGQNPPAHQNSHTTLVRLTSGMLNKLRAHLTTNPNSAVTIDSFTANTDYTIYQVPNYPGAAGIVPQFGGLQFDKTTGWLYVNDEIGVGGGGFVRAYDTATLASIANTPSDTSSVLVSNQVTSGLGNGGLSLLNLGLYIGDTESDTTNPFEPDASATAAPDVPWESPNIVAAKEDMAGLSELPEPATDAQAGPDGSDTVLGGVTRYIYVQVNNFGPTATTGIEQLNVYWAKGSSTLGWPQPWDGTGPVDPMEGLPLGGPIPGATGVAIPAIPPFGKAIVGPLPWDTPDPNQYSVQDGHFCLLARIVTPNANYAETSFAGMSFPEAAGQASSLNANVVNNARIAWRNIHITDDNIGDDYRRGGVVAINYGGLPLLLRFGFELLDGHLRPAKHTGRPVRIAVKGAAVALLERAVGSRLKRHESRSEEALMELHDLASGIDKLHLEPGENLTFHVEFTPPEERQDYALRASAYAVEGGEERLIGGQTFLFRRKR
jgi:hypothetical protein